MILIVVVVEAVRVPKQDRRTEELEIASLVAIEERGKLAGGSDVVDKGLNLLVVAERRTRGAATWDSFAGGTDGEKVVTGVLLLGVEGREKNCNGFFFLFVGGCEWACGEEMKPVGSFDFFFALDVINGN